VLNRNGESRPTGLAIVPAGTLLSGSVSRSSPYRALSRSYVTRHRPLTTLVTPYVVAGPLIMLSPSLRVTSRPTRYTALP